LYRFITKNHGVRRIAATSLALACLAGVAPIAHAEWPNDRPIKLIVPSAAGGTPDYSSRKIAADLSVRLKQSVVVENRPGAIGTIAMQSLATSPADGYTIAFGNVVTMAISRSLMPRLPYDPDKAFVPVIALWETPNLLVARNDLGVTNLAGLITRLKEKPGALFMGSAGNGTTSHLSGEMFKTVAKVQFQHVPYRGSPQAIQDLIGGSVDFMFDNLPSMVRSVQAGQVRALAITSRNRSPLLPNVPTMAEAGLPGFEMMAWGGIVAPAGTPKAVVDRLNQEINAYLKSPGAQADLAQNASIPMGGSPAFFSQYIATESHKWAEIVRQSGARID
jgi:tripartite-type tricarboxylate transporter receptor subunit TctC